MGDRGVAVAFAFVFAKVYMTLGEYSEATFFPSFVFPSAAFGLALAFAFVVAAAVGPCADPCSFPFPVCVPVSGASFAVASLREGVTAGEGVSVGSKALLLLL